MEERFNTAPLREYHDLVCTANSQSTKSNARKGRELLRRYSSLKGFEDPISVSPSSSLFVMNLIADHCRFGTPNALKADSMNSTIQSLRIAYLEAGHRQSWHVDVQNGKAHGNPLISNPEIDNLRRAHRVLLARYGNLQRKVKPITVEIVSAHAEKFWFGMGEIPDPRDVQLHAILIVGLNLGLRFDEISKLKTENVSTTSGTCSMSIGESIKNSTVNRDYVIREWPGNSSIRHSVYMDPFTAVLSWLLVRGEGPGPFFCDISMTGAGFFKVNHRKAWSSKSFKNFLQHRLRSIGVGSSDSLRYSGHSMKRGSVQLYRTLGLRDEMIMQIVQMTGNHAYANYCAAYNDCAPDEVPRFTSVSEYIRHAEEVFHEKQIVHDDDALERFLVQLGITDDDPVQ